MAEMKYGCLLLLPLFVACGPAPQKHQPSLTPQQAGELLHYNNKAQTWIKYVRRNHPDCNYRVDLPNQSSHPTVIDLKHIVTCGGSASPMEFDASVSFAYDPNQQTWTISKFSN